MASKTISQPTLTDEEYNARFEQEVAAYVAMHAQLLDKYESRWVAIYGGQVIDADVDDIALLDRVTDQYGQESPVFFHRVTRNLFEEVEIPGID